MKPAALIGIVLIALGLSAVAYQSFTYTTRDTVIDIGPITATADREHTLPLSPVLGMGVIAGGIVFLIVGMRKRPVL